MDNTLPLRATPGCYLIALSRWVRIVVSCLVVLPFLTVLSTPPSLSLSAPDLQQLSSDGIVIHAYGYQFQQQDIRLQQEWGSVPRVHLHYNGPQSLEDTVRRSLSTRQLWLDPNGKNLHVDVHLLEENLVSVTVRSGEKVIHNHHQLFAVEALDSWIDKQWEKLFPASVFEPLPRIIFVQNALGLILPESQMLSRTAHFSIFMHYGSRLALKSHQQPLEYVELPFLPLVQIDGPLLKTHQVTILTEPEALPIRVGGKDLETPLTIQMEGGVHQLTIAGKKHHIFVTDSATFSYDFSEELSILRLDANVPVSVHLYPAIDSLGDPASLQESWKWSLVPGEYRLTVFADGYQTTEISVYIGMGEDKDLSVKMKGLPGTLQMSFDLPVKYDAIDMKDDWLVVSNPSQSVLFFKGVLEPGFVWKEGYVSAWRNGWVFDHTIVDRTFTPRWQTEYRICAAYENPQSLIIHTSDGKVRAFHPEHLSVMWERTVDYLPVRFLTHGSMVILLSVFSELIVLDVQSGYAEIIRERLTGNDQMELLLNPGMSNHSFSLFFPRTNLVAEVYPNHRRMVLTDQPPVSDRADRIEDNYLILDGRTFLRFEDSPVLFHRTADRIAVLFDSKVQVYFGP